MNKFEEVFQEMERYVSELQKNFEEKAVSLDEESKVKANLLVEKTKTTINDSIAKVKSVIDDIKDDEKVDEFLAKIVAKSKEAVDFTSKKIDELANSNAKKSAEELFANIIKDFDKLKDSDTFKKTQEFLKEINDRVNEFFERPAVVGTINKVKSTTVNIAEKGVEGLKKILKTDETNSSEENKDNSDQQ